MYKLVHQWAITHDHGTIAGELANFYDQNGNTIHASDQDEDIWKMAHLCSPAIADAAVEFHHWLAQQLTGFTLTPPASSDKGE